MNAPQRVGAPQRVASRLLLIDFDNTLIDRAGAFERWATSFVEGHGAAASDIEWLVDADGDGLVARETLVGLMARETLVGLMAAHFALRPDERDAALQTLRRGWIEHIELDDRIVDSLAVARAAGWAVVVVTNGIVAQQERKLRHPGLDRHIDGSVISEGVGVRKPDPRIFHLAADVVGLPMLGWMVGDSVEADIVGAARVGLSTNWLHRGRIWTRADLQPTQISDSCAAAILRIVDS